MKIPKFYPFFFLSLIYSMMNSYSVVDRMAEHKNNVRKKNKTKQEKALYGMLTAGSMSIGIGTFLYMMRHDKTSSKQDPTEEQKNFPSSTQEEKKDDPTPDPSPTQPHNFENKSSDSSHVEEKETENSVSDVPTAPPLSISSVTTAAVGKEKPFKLTDALLETQKAKLKIQELIIRPANKLMDDKLRSMNHYSTVLTPKTKILPQHFKTLKELILPHFSSDTDVLEVLTIKPTLCSLKFYTLNEPDNLIKKIKQETSTQLLQATEQAEHKNTSFWLNDHYIQERSLAQSSKPTENP